MRELTTTNLEVAVWIARLGSFTAAAERMHTTQPAVSARVKELEGTLGQKLFVRQGRGVELRGREFFGSRRECRAIRCSRQLYRHPDVRSPIWA